jgi:hypothetical protein
MTGIMSSDQASTYGSMKLNVLGIQTGYDPFAEYLRSSKDQGG